jgi:uncharacterized protein YbbC (DUF1343 family)
MRIAFLISLSALLNISCVSAPAPIKSAAVKPGCEQTSLYIPQLQGKSVAMVANHTSLIGESHLADSLIRSGINLIKIFSPEHGFRSEAGAGDVINNGRDTQTGLPIISLYGSGKKPTPGDLKGVDIVLYDIQDVGVRFYTFISTLHYVMEACAENNIPLLILDRPNPLGFYIDGPLRDPCCKSFVGMHPIPVVYGMTVGELAQMINGEGWLAGEVTCNLQVIPCKDYDHNVFYNLSVNPSPNLNSMEAVYLYPSLCFFEGTMMSLGRGTPYPFRVVGHPDYPDKTFSFMPQSTSINQHPVLMDQTCYGIDLRPMTCEQLMEMHSLNLRWLLDVYKTMGRGDEFFNAYFDKLAGTDKLRKQITEGWSESQIRESWQPGLREFREKRTKYLLYKDFSN